MVGTGSGECEVVVQTEDGSAGLLEDKKRCRIVSDKRCVMCDSGVGEGVVHFLMGCGGFEKYQLMLLENVCRILGARECLDEFWRVDRGEWWHCCWEKGWRAYVKE